MRDHGDNCVAAAQAWLAANHVDNMETKPDAMQAMMRLSAAKNRAKAAQDRAKAANNDALQAEQEKDAAEKEVQELQRVLGPKRARTHAASALTMRTVVVSHQTTGTSLIIVVRLHVFKTAAQLLSALEEKFQLHRKARRVNWSILDWGLWDGLRTGVLEIVLLL